MKNKHFDFPNGYLYWWLGSTHRCSLSKSLPNFLGVENFYPIYLENSLNKKHS